MPTRTPARPWQYLLLALLLGVAGTYHVRSGYEIARARLQPERVPRAPVVPGATTDAIGQLQPEAAAAGIAEGDRLVAVEDRAYTGQHVLASALHRLGPGARARLSVVSGEAPARAVDVRLRSLADNVAGGSVFDLVFGLALPLLCVPVGFGVAFLRPWDRHAWLVLLLLLGFANFSPGLPQQAAWGDLARVPTLAYTGFFSVAWPIGILLFGLYFPERLAFDRRRPWLKWVVLGPLVALALLRGAQFVAISESTALARGLLPAGRLLQPWTSLLVTVAVSCGFAALGFKAGSAASPDVRRRLRLLSWGGGIGLGPIGLLAVAGIFTRSDLFAVAPQWLTLPALALVPVFPATLAYVVVVQRALDLRTTIRQGLQYALARGGIRVLQVALSAAVIAGALGLLASPEINRPRRITVLALGVAAVFLARALARRLLGFTDRRFFREAYDAERVLAELSEQVRTIPERAVLLDTVARCIADTLHVPQLAVLLAGGGRFTTADALGRAADVSFSASGGTAAHLARERRPAFVYPEDPASWLWREQVPQDEQQALGRLHAQLLLPMSVKDQLLGFLALGPKRSEEAYSASDVRLLSSVAGQTALAVENARLTQAVADEAAQRARMTREIEIAREVQESLYPQEHPDVVGLDYAGRCRPARGVGGDYFDFRVLEHGGFGLAIGDVSGKGIPAALLMASLQASIRGQELAGSDDLGALMANVNRMIYEASPSNRYATLFYGRYDRVTRRLRFVNAGHNPPMLFRADGGLERLEAGGPVAGLLPMAAYVEGASTLGPGDRLLLYTDGISESMNAADEEWGEERLAIAVRAAGDVDAGALLDRIFEGADAFAAGADQHDDMTLVVLRVTG